MPASALPIPDMASMTVPLRRSLPLLAAVLAASLAAPAASRADAGDVIVRFAPGTDAGDRADARQDADVTRQDTLPLPRTEVVDPKPGTSTTEAIADLERDRDVAYAEPDAPRASFDTLPNEQRFRSLWAFQNTGQVIGSAAGTSDADIDAPAAWDVTTGNPNVTVAVVDSGVDLLHPDLLANLWTNTKEIAGDGKDNDGNGFVDDVGGWDFANGAG